MALKKTITERVKTMSFIEGQGTVEQSEEDRVFNDCYIKVESVAGSKTIMSATVSTKLSESTTVSANYSFTPNMNGGNFIAQAYEHLKTLPEFEGAVDC